MNKTIFYTSILMSSLLAANASFNKYSSENYVVVSYTDCIDNKTVNYVYLIDEQYAEEFTLMTEAFYDNNISWLNQCYNYIKLQHDELTLKAQNLQNLNLQHNSNTDKEIKSKQSLSEINEQCKKLDFEIELLREIKLKNPFLSKKSQ